MSNSAAFKLIQDLAQELSRGTVDLPGFPTVLAQVCRAVDHPNNTAEQTARVLSVEPALAGRLLTMANSAAFSQAGRPISDLKSAVTRLGNNVVRAAASTFAVNQLKRQTSLAGIHDRLEILWKRSTYLAAMCHVLGRHCKVNPEEALLTGLLHGIGTLYLLVRTVEHAALADELIDLTWEWNAPLTRTILENWSFPEAVAQAAGDQEEFERRHTGGADLADVLICAKLLFQCDGDPGCVQEKYNSVPAFPKVGLTTHQFISVLQHAELQIAAMQEVLSA